MIDRSVSVRYAEALFAAASDEGSTAALMDDLESLEALITSDKSLVLFLESPAITDAHKLGLLDSLFGSSTSPIFIRMLRLLLRKNRIPYLLDIIGEYRKLRDRSLGFLDALVTSAVPMPQDQAERLHTQLERLSGRRVRLERRTDPRLIAGFHVMLGRHAIDCSLRHRIDSMKRDLLEPGGLEGAA
ncbi:ATP synthase F1 subunit delta [Candidatus Fermentibacteria bacterium]|nr:ATP synthase F1 subunit delta [Candidatus Fermentibacteria bacterium]